MQWCGGGVDLRWPGKPRLSGGMVTDCGSAAKAAAPWRLWLWPSWVLDGRWASEWPVPEAHSVLETPLLSGCKRDCVKPHPCSLPPGGVLNLEDHHPLGLGTVCRLTTTEATLGPAEETRAHAEVGPVWPGWLLGLGIQ
ncbi:hypothetical protein NDU88_005763 [Pleurodeles waltl]|uniref:Uncharacterized protein n=1 Tax=Pleurodeles waltl TaxID=8319 RepID=A0AAV7VMQ8_PLEWA|nr:hypothetical protein NDU88_005763 [Pleurodeles waltl]